MRKILSLSIAIGLIATITALLTIFPKSAGYFVPSLGILLVIDLWVVANSFFKGEINETKSNQEKA